MSVEGSGGTTADPKNNHYNPSIDLGLVGASDFDPYPVQTEITERSPINPVNESNSTPVLRGSEFHLSVN